MVGGGGGFCGSIVDVDEVVMSKKGERKTSNLVYYKGCSICF